MVEVYVTRLLDGSFWFHVPGGRWSTPRGVTGIAMEGPFNEIQLQAIANLLCVPADEPTMFLIVAK